jgi:hypothetical protein
MYHMKHYSTRQAAGILGISMATMNRYIVASTIPVPPLSRVGGVTVRLWSEKHLTKAKAILAGFTDGRRTRHRKGGKG